MSNTDLRYLEWRACPRSVACCLDAGHEGDCDLLPRWPGMPDPHRHNPFAVAIAAVVIGTAWVVCAVVVLALIGGWRP